MDTINLIITKAFDFILLPFRTFNPVWGLCAVSVIAGVVLLKLFGIVSNQGAIKKIKNKIKACIYEVVLYRDNLRISLTAVLRMLGYNFVYMRHALVPLCVMIVPFVFIYAQLDARYSSRPLSVGETTIVTIKTNDAGQDHNFLLRSSDGIAIETSALRIKEKNEVCWRIKAQEKGQHTVTVISPQNKEYSIPISVECSPGKLPSGRYMNLFDSLMNPVSKKLKTSADITMLQVTYPSADYKLFSFHFHWLMIFLVVSIVAGLIFKRFLRVEI